MRREEYAAGLGVDDVMMFDLRQRLVFFNSGWWFGTIMFPYIWVNYNDLTVTSLESWFSKGNHPLLR